MKKKEPFDPSCCNEECVTEITIAESPGTNLEAHGLVGDTTRASHLNYATWIAKHPVRIQDAGRPDARRMLITLKCGFVLR